MVVQSPFGDHDTDYLSDGEKEILHVFAHLYRFRHLQNIVLWDTPELHLNAALESRLYDSLVKVAPSNQTWIATHSLEFINSVPLENIFEIRQEGESASVLRASGEERRTKVMIYQEMGAQIGLQLVSTVVVFVEGKNAHSDKRILDRLVAPNVPGTNFIAGGSCENILSLGTRTNDLLHEASTNGDFLAVVDRDYRSDDEMEQTVKKYKGKLFIWDVHEIDNLFLEPELVYETLNFFDRQDFRTPEEVRESIKSTAKDLREWIAADWVAWDFDRRFQPPSRRISGADPKNSLHKYAAKLHLKCTEATESVKLDELFQEKLNEVDQIIADEKWLIRLPGKQMLNKFLEKWPTIRTADYIKATVSIMLDRDYKHSEVERLVMTIHNVLSGNN